MNKQLRAAVVALAALGLAPAANATVVEGIQLSSGDWFDHFEGEATSSGAGQVDLFAFNLDVASTFTTALLTSAANPKQDLEFESVDLDGVHFFSITNGFLSKAELNPVALAAGDHVLRVKYSSTAAKVTYAGDITINPVVEVPAPTSWAVMFAGIGGLGFTMRRRMQTAKTTRVAFA
jgi:hypothetical protein